MEKNKKQKVKLQSFGNEVLSIAKKAVKKTLAENDLLLKLQKIRKAK